MPRNRALAVAALLVFLLGSQLPLVAAAEDLNLGSTTASIPASRSGVINVGGRYLNVKSGAQLTGAESVALTQVLNTGRQSIVVNAQGAASGGSFVVNSIPNISSLIIPDGVRAYANVAHGPVDFGSQLTNAGSLFVYSNNVAVTSGTLTATNILNNTSGLISSVLPTTSAAWLNAIPNLSFALNAAQSVVNNGRIVSAANLSIVSPNTTNTGSMTASNLSLLSPTDLSFTGAGGNITALNTVSFAGQNIDVVGGDILSQTLNFTAPEGKVAVRMGNVSGLVNVAACAASVIAGTPDLRFGTFSVTGDPVIANYLGSVTLPAITTNGQNLAVIATGDITGTPGTSISTNASGVGQNAGTILMVAGAYFPEDPSLSSTTTLSIEGGYVGGGSIDLSMVNSISATGLSGAPSNGGNITFVAYRGTSLASTNGAISLPALSTFGGTGGNNGNVNIISSFDSGGTAVTVGPITTTAQATKSGGAVSIAVATPIIVGPAVVVTDVVANPSPADGTVQSGSFTPGLLRNGDILLNGNIDASNPQSRPQLATSNVTILTAGSIDGGTTQITTAGRIPTPLEGVQGKNGGDVTLYSRSGSIDVLSIDAQGSLGTAQTADGGSGGNGGAVYVAAPAGPVSVNLINTSGGNSGGGGIGTNGTDYRNADLGTAGTSTDGVAGASGGDGTAGKNGGSGGNAGSIQVFSGAHVATSIYGQGGIGASGGSGGDGGFGQKGQRGGPLIFCCKSGSGGNGGDGGKGGAGGNAGNGGDGAIVTISATSASVGFIIANGGDGGFGGLGGVGGNGGAGGDAGNNGGIGQSGNGGHGGDGANGANAGTAGSGGNAGGVTIQVEDSFSSGGIIVNGGAGGNAGNAGNGGTGGAGGAAGNNVGAGTGGSAGSGGLGGTGYGGGNGGATGRLAGTAVSISAGNGISVAGDVLAYGGNGGIGGAGGSGARGGTGGAGGNGAVGGGQGGTGGNGGGAGGGGGGGAGGTAGAIQMTADLSSISIGGSLNAHGGNGGRGGAGGSGGSGANGAGGGDAAFGVIGFGIGGAAGQGGQGGFPTAGAGGGGAGNGGDIKLTADYGAISVAQNIYSYGGTGGAGGVGGNGSSGGNGASSGIGISFVGTTNQIASNVSINVTVTGSLNIGTVGSAGGFGTYGGNGGAGGAGGAGGDIALVSHSDLINVGGSLDASAGTDGDIGQFGINGTNGRVGQTNVYFGIGLSLNGQGSTSSVPMAGLGFHITANNLTIGAMGFTDPITLLLGPAIKGLPFSDIAVYGNLNNSYGESLGSYRAQLGLSWINPSFTDILTKNGEVIRQNENSGLALVIYTGAYLFGKTIPEPPNRTFTTYNGGFSIGTGGYTSGSQTTSIEQQRPPIPSTYGPTYTAGQLNAVGGVTSSAPTGNVVLATGTGTPANGGNIHAVAGKTLDIAGTVKATGGATLALVQPPAGQTSATGDTAQIYFGRGGLANFQAQSITILGNGAALPAGISAAPGVFPDAIQVGSATFTTEFNGATYLFKPVVTAQLTWSPVGQSSGFGLNIGNGGLGVLVTNPTTLIQNRTGGVDLGNVGGKSLFTNGVYNANGDLVVLAAGSIRASGVTNGSIITGTNTSRPTGQIILAAGDAAALFNYGVTPQGSPQPSQPLYQWIAVGGSSKTGGDVYLPNVSIGSGNTYNVFVSAHGGEGDGHAAAPLGTINVRSVTTTQGQSIPGSIYMVGSGNFFAAGALKSDMVQLVSFGDALGQGGFIGNLTNPLSVNAKWLSANTPVAVVINSLAPETNLLYSQASFFAFQQSGHLNVLGGINGVVIELGANSLEINAPITALGTNGLVSITTNQTISSAIGIGNITSPGLSFTSLQGDVIVGSLTAASGVVLRGLSPTSTVTSTGFISTKVLGLFSGSGGAFVNQTNAQELEVTSLGDVIVTDTSAVSLGTGQGHFPNFCRNINLTAPAITVDGAIQATGSIVFDTTASNGNIVLNRSIVAAQSVSLLSGGSIFQPTGVIQAPTSLTLKAAGDIGRFGEAIETNAGSLQITLTGTGQSLYLVNLNSNSALSINDALTVRNLAILSIGDLTINAPINASESVDLRALHGAQIGSANLKFNADVTATQALVLEADDAVQQLSGNLTTDNLTVFAGSPGILGPVVGTPINTLVGNSGSIAINTIGRVGISNIGNVGSLAGTSGPLQFSNAGNVAIGTLHVQGLAGINATGAISVSQLGASAPITLNAGGDIVSAGALGVPNLRASVVNLISATGDISVATTNGIMPLVLTVTTGGASVAVLNIGQVILNSSPSPLASFSLTTNPDSRGNGSVRLNFGAVVTSPSITIGSSEFGTGIGGISQADPMNLASNPTLVGSAINLFDHAPGSLVNGHGTIAVRTNAAGGSLSVNTSGDVFVVNSGNVSLNPSRGNNFNLVTTGAGATGIALNGLVTGLTAVNLSVDGVGAITQSAPGINIDSPRISLLTTNGDIGTLAGNAIGVQNQRGNNAVTLFTFPNGTADVNISFSDSGRFGVLTLGSATFAGQLSASGTYQVTAAPGAKAANIVVAQPISANNINLDLRNGGTNTGSITLFETLTGATQVSLAAAGSGEINEVGTAVVNGPAVSLSLGTGTIGTLGEDSRPFVLQNGTAGPVALALNTAGGNAFLQYASNSIITIVNSTGTWNSFELDANAGNIVVASPLSASSVVLSTVSDETNNGFIVFQNTAVTATTSITITSGGTGFVSQIGPGISLSAPVVSVTSELGDIGSSFRALRLSGTGTLSVNGGNDVYVDHVGAITVLPSQAGNTFTFTNDSSATVNSIGAYGNILVLIPAGDLAVAPASYIIADSGSVTLNVLSNAGTIDIGTNSAIVSHNSAGGAVNIFLGNSPAFSANPLPASVPIAFGSATLTRRVPGFFTTGADGLLSFGANGISASGPTNFVSSRGTNSQIFFDTNGAPASSIHLGGGVAIGTSTIAPLGSLDLTDPAVVTTVRSAQSNGLLGGRLTVNASNQVTGGTLFVSPLDVSRTISGLNVPARVRLDLSSFSLPFNINITSASFTKQVLISGTLNLRGTNTSTINLSTNQALPSLVLANRAVLSSIGPLNVITDGSVVVNGTLSARSGLSLHTTNAADGNVTLGTRMTVGGVLAVAAAGDISTLAAISARSIRFTAGGATGISLGSSLAATNGALYLRATNGAIDANNTLRANGTVTINALGDVDLAASINGTNIFISSGGNLAAAAMRGTNIRATAADIELLSAVSAPRGLIILNATNGDITTKGSLQASTGATFNATGDVDLDNSIAVRSGGLSINALGDVSASSALSARSISIDAGGINGITLESAATATNGGMSLTASAGSISSAGMVRVTRGNLAIESGNNVALNRAVTVSGGSLQILSAGSISAVALTAGNDISMTANAGTTTLSGVVSSTQQGSVNIISDGTVSTRGIRTGNVGVGNNISINVLNGNFVVQPKGVLQTVNGDINIETENASNGTIDTSAGSIRSSRSGNLTIESARDLKLGAVALTTGSTTAESLGGALILTGNTSTRNGAVSLSASDAMTGDLTVIGTVSAAGDTTFTAAGPGGVTINSTLTLTSGTLIVSTTHGPILTSAPVRITQGDATFSSADTMTFNGSVIDANGNIAATAGGNFTTAQATTVSARGNIVLRSANGSMTLNGAVATVQSGAVELHSFDMMSVGRISTGNTGPLGTNDVIADVVNANFVLLPGAMITTGNNGNVRITTANSSNGSIDTSAGTIRVMKNGSISETSEKDIIVGNTIVNVGSIQISANGGPLTVASGRSISVSRGDLNLSTANGSGNMTINGTLSTLNSGNISLLVGNSIQINQRVSSAGGLSIVVPVPNSGSIDTSANGVLEAHNGTLELTTTNSATGSITLNGAVQRISSQTGPVLITSARDIVIGSVSNSNGLIRVEAASDGLTVNDNARITAQGPLADIYLLEDGTGANDRISFGANVLVQTVAQTAGNGNIMVSVGNFDSAECCDPGPPNVHVTKIGSGDVFFGSNFTNGISAIGSNSLRAKNANITFFVNGSSLLGDGAITLGGNNNFSVEAPASSLPIVWANMGTQNDFVVDTELDGN